MIVAYLHLEKQKTDDLLAVCARHTPLVEPYGDGTFVGFTSREQKKPYHMARMLYEELASIYGPSLTAGISTSRFVAKAAWMAVYTGLIKGTGGSAPLLAVRKGSEQRFLAGLPIPYLWPLDEVTRRKLTHLGLHTIGQIAAVPKGELIMQLGDIGKVIYRYARGIDYKPVLPLYPPRSVSEEFYFEQEISAEQIIYDCLQKAARGIESRLGRDGLVGKVVTLELTCVDGKAASRKRTLKQPTSKANDIYKATKRIIKSVEVQNPISEMIVAVGDLEKPRFRQLTLFQERETEKIGLEKLLAQIRSRFGDRSIDFGHSLKPSRRERMLSLYGESI